MLLSLIMAFPLAGAILVSLFKNPKVVRSLTLVITLCEFALSLLILKDFDKSTAALQMVEKIPWIPEFGISYFMAVDGISIWLVLLTTILTPLIILGSWTAIEKQVRGFHVCMLLLESAMIGTFFAMDSILFYIFFEASLVPMYFIVGIWGGARRIYASIKFFIFTMVGSLLMLVAIIALMYMSYDQLGSVTASLPELYRLKIPFVANSILNPQTLMFFAFSLAFAIKVPVFPFHTWLPDAHVEAPTPGSVILAGVMLKMGTYGFVRFVLPLFPAAADYWANLFLWLGVIGVVYGALVAMIQPDIKKLVAYSSVSHMGYVLIGIFAMNSYGLTGGMYQMLNHGVSTGALFLLVGMLYERTHSREIKDYGGLAPVMPWFAIIFFVVTLSSIAVPGTNGFVGEFLILLGIYAKKPLFAYIAVTGVILGAAYMLWMFKRVFFGKAGKLVEGHELKDLNFREVMVLAPLLVLIFWMGIKPDHFLKYSKASIDHLINNRANYSLIEVGGVQPPTLGK